VIQAPFALSTNGGPPPTALKARTGELTPPGKNRSARCCRALDLLWVGIADRGFMMGSV
jgi:hypothetical protein